MKAFLRIAILPILLIFLWLVQAQTHGYGMAALYVAIWTVLMIPAGFLMYKLNQWLYD